MKKNDFILIGILVLAGLLSLLIYNIVFNDEGTMVIVTVDGEVYAELPLNQDSVTSITGTAGTDTLTIQDGKARISQADCPDLICYHHKPISMEGETIVCLPNKIVISIKGSTSSGLDAVAR